MPGDDDESKFVFPDGFPEEAKEQVMAEHRRTLMAQEADVHQLLGFLTGLTYDDMRVLRGILRGCQGDTNVAAYYEGVLSLLMSQKVNRCWACDKDHDADLAGLLESSAPEPTVQTHQALVDEADGSVKIVEFSMDAVIANAARWRVEFIGPQGPNCPVVCLGCSMRYTSLTDRMLRDPEDCHGCIEKAKWG